jgi:RNA polymerase sigma-70 factor (ECF subfamily)
MSRRVYGFASVRGAADPEGLVNDVFLKVFTSLHNFVGNEIQFSAWVFKIARNTLIDEARRRKRRPATTELTKIHDSPTVLADVELEAIGHLNHDWLLAQLDLLTLEQRDVVVMRVVSDLTVEAIAEVLGKPVGAVKAMQRRAFRTLARNFNDQAVPK